MHKAGYRYSVEEEYECPRCNGSGSEDISLTASLFDHEFALDGVLTKTCERCDGDGEIHDVRELRLDELSDAQVKTLLHADIYRESGGEEAKKQQKKAQRMKRRGSGGPTPSPTNKAGRSALRNP